MKSETILTVVILGAVAVGGYLVYKHYNPTASKKNNTVLTDVQFGLAAAPSIIGGIRSLFPAVSSSPAPSGGGDNSEAYDLYHGY